VKVQHWLNGVLIIGYNYHIKMAKDENLFGWFSRKPPLKMDCELKSWKSLDLWYLNLCAPKQLKTIWHIFDFNPG